MDSYAIKIIVELYTELLTSNSNKVNYDATNGSLDNCDIVIAYPNISEQEKIDTMYKYCLLVIDGCGESDSVILLRRLFDIANRDNIKIDMDCLLTRSIDLDKASIVAFILDYKNKYIGFNSGSCDL